MNANNKRENNNNDEDEKNDEDVGRGKKGQSTTGMTVAGYRGLARGGGPGFIAAGLNIRISPASVAATR
jgi:hypothetical protein